MTPKNDTKSRWIHGSDPDAVALEGEGDVDFRDTPVRDNNPSLVRVVTGYLPHCELRPR